MPGSRQTMEEQREGGGLRPASQGGWDVGSCRFLPTGAVRHSSSTAARGSGPLVRHALQGEGSMTQEQHTKGATGRRVLVLSLLFNWPSAGGGIHHTVELIQALKTAGFDVAHIFAKYSE
jgi:hypothetical protein